MTLDINAIRKVLGAELRRVRESRGWTREELAEACPFAIQGRTVATYEQGTRTINIVRLYELCAVMGVDVSKLLALVENKTEERRLLADVYSP